MDITLKTKYKPSNYDDRLGTLNVKIQNSYFAQISVVTMSLYGNNFDDYTSSDYPNKIYSISDLAVSGTEDEFTELITSYAGPGTLSDNKAKNIIDSSTSSKWAYSIGYNYNESSLSSIQNKLSKGVTSSRYRYGDHENKSNNWLYFDTNIFYGHWLDSISSITRNSEGKIVISMKNTTLPSRFQTVNTRSGYLYNLYDNVNNQINNAGQFIIDPNYSSNTYEPTHMIPNNEYTKTSGYTYNYLNFFRDRISFENFTRSQVRINSWNINSTGLLTVNFDSDGLGNYELYVNGSKVSTTTSDYFRYQLTKFGSNTFYIKAVAPDTPSSYSLRVDRYSRTDGGDKNYIFSNYLTCTFLSNENNSSSYTGYYIKQPTINVTKTGLNTISVLVENPNSFNTTLYLRKDSSSSYSTYSLNAGEVKILSMEYSNPGNYQVNGYLKFSTYESSTTRTSITLNRLPNPYNLRFEQNSLNPINSGYLMLNVDRPYFEDGEAIIYLNDIEINTFEIRNISYYIWDIPYSTSTISIQIIPNDNSVPDSFKSDKVDTGVIMNKLPKPVWDGNPTIRNTNRVYMSWTSNIPDDITTSYICSVDSISSGENSFETNNTNIIINNISQGLRTLSVYQKFIDDEDYNSEVLNYSLNFPKIQAPTLSKVDNIGNLVFTVDGYDCYALDTGEVVRVSEYTTGNIRQGVNSITFNFGVASGESYDIYTKFDENPYTRAFNTNDTYWTLNISNRGSYGDAGIHTVKVKSVFREDESYNSEFSNEVSYNVNILDTPSAIWSSTIESNPLYESRVEWMPVQTTSLSGQYADMYLIEAIGNNAEYVTPLTVLQPSDLTKKLYCWVPSLDPVGNPGVMDDSEISLFEDENRSRHSILYSINVRALSFNSWYVGGSENSTLSYEVIKLASPTGLSFNPNTNTLSWNQVADATTYRIYRNDSLIGESHTTSYNLSDVESGLNKFSIEALRITTMEV